MKMSATVQTKIRKGARKSAKTKTAADKAPVDGMFRGSDVGSQLAIDRELVEYAADVHVPDDPDDKRSLTRVAPRAKRIWAPDRLVQGRNPALNGEQYQAAQKFYDDFVIGELGARPNQMRSLIRADPWDRLPFSERQAMRRQSFRAAVMAVGLRFSNVLVWCVLQETGSPDVPPTCEAFAKAQSPPWTTDRAVVWLAAALEAAAVHYGIAKRASVRYER